jgi:hypothetical protein
LDHYEGCAEPKTIEKWIEPVIVGFPMLWTEPVIIRIAYVMDRTCDDGNLYTRPIADKP